MKLCQASLSKHLPLPFIILSCGSNSGVSLRIHVAEASRTSDRAADGSQQTNSSPASRKNPVTLLGIKTCKMSSSTKVLNINNLQPDDHVCSSSFSTVLIKASPDHTSLLQVHNRQMFGVMLMRISNL